MDENMTAKAHLRREMRIIRDNFLAELPDMAKSLAFSTAPSPLHDLIKQADIVAGYHPVASEAPVTKLLKEAAALGKNISLPHVVSRVSPMRFLEWEYGQPLADGPFGLKQPLGKAAETRPDLILVPLLAFDRNLGRLGQGAGHYDRALSLLDGAIKIGVAWSVQEIETVPTDLWDIPLDAVLTEREWII